MPKCSLCQKSVPDQKDLTLVRDPHDKWVVACAECLRLLEKGQKGADEKNGAGTNGAGVARDEPTEALVEKIRETLEELQAEKKAVPRTHERAYQRRSVDLRVRFRLQRDDARCVGRVRDISQGGMRFTTKRELPMGQIILIEVDSREEDVATAMLQTTAEVRRVRDLRDGTYEVGVRFVRRIRANHENRRQYKRYEANMAVYYTRAGSEITFKGTVCDISQGGVRILLDERVDKGEEMSVILRGEGESALKADLAGLVRVVRVKPQERGAYELGCQFLNVGVKALREQAPPADKAADRKNSA